jgi:phosphatidylserine decarboxylase
LLSPADGTITDIEQVEPDQSFGRSAWRIGIFLSIFNVHINRAPCAVRVGQIRYRPGAFGNAMNPRSGRANESNDIQMFRLEEPTDELLVRQISGAIARRIVCAAKTGSELAAGQRFGMIKFGSRTELYVPVGENIKLAVKLGDKVRAGVSVLGRYE